MPAPPTPAPTPSVTSPAPALPAVGATDHPFVTQLHQAKEWWDYLIPWLPLVGSLATLAAALIAAKMVRDSVAQKREADNRAEWWRRVQWGLDAVNSENENKKLAGMKALGVLALSDLVPRSERQVLTAAWKASIPEDTDSLVTVEVVADNGYPQPSGSPEEEEDSE